MSRTELIQVKVSPEEKRTIRKLAERHGVYPSQFLRAVGLRSQLGDNELQAIMEEDRLVRMEHAVGEARASKPLEEFSVESPGTIDAAMTAERKRIEDDPANLNTTLDEKGSVVKDTREEVLRVAERDSWISSTARILMMEKGLSKVAATMQASKEWDKR